MRAWQGWLPLALLPLAPLALSAPAQGQAAASPARDLDQVARYIKAVRSLTADFTQTDRRGQTLRGNLILKQPGRIRFDYGKSANMLIVGDGKALTLIDYDVQQVQRWPIGSSPLSALIDPSKDISRFGKVVPTGDPDVVTVEARDPKRPEFGVLTLIFTRRASAPAGLELYGWVAKDAQNNRTAVRLSNQTYNRPVSDSAFQWRDPRQKGRRQG